MVYFQVLRDILKEVQGNMVPRSMLKEWALHTFPNATDYWTFRKMFTIQLALIGLAEFMLHLNRLNPEMLQIAQVGNARKHTNSNVLDFLWRRKGNQFDKGKFNRYTHS